MDPLYKVGDKVLIKSTYDPGCAFFSYRFSFTNDMLYAYGGKICEIVEVKKPMLNGIPIVSDDGYLYHLREDNGNFCWASSMFEPEF